MRAWLSLWPLAAYLVGVFGGVALILAWWTRERIGR